MEPKVPISPPHHYLNPCTNDDNNNRFPPNHDQHSMYRILYTVRRYFFIYYALSIKKSRCPADLGRPIDRFFSSYRPQQMPTNSTYNLIISIRMLYYNIIIEIAAVACCAFSFEQPVFFKRSRGSWTEVMNIIITNQPSVFIFFVFFVFLRLTGGQANTQEDE